MSAKKPGDQKCAAKALTKIDADRAIVKFFTHDCGMGGTRGCWRRGMFVVCARPGKKLGIFRWPEHIRATRPQGHFLHVVTKNTSIDILWVGTVPEINITSLVDIVLNGMPLK
jgi:hypothetical protein